MIVGAVDFSAVCRGAARQPKGLDDHHGPSNWLIKPLHGMFRTSPEFLAITVAVCALISRLETGKPVIWQGAISAGRRAMHGRGCFLSLDATPPPGGCGLYAGAVAVT